MLLFGACSFSRSIFWSQWETVIRLAQVSAKYSYLDRRCALETRFKSVSQIYEVLRANYGALISYRATPPESRVFPETIVQGGRQNLYSGHWILRSHSVLLEQKVKLPYDLIDSILLWCVLDNFWGELDTNNQSWEGQL